MEPEPPGHLGRPKRHPCLPGFPLIGKGGELPLNKTLKDPIRPFVPILGDQRSSGKLEALRQLLDKVDKVIIGGGMAFTFLKGSKGMEGIWENPNLGPEGIPIFNFRNWKARDQV